MTFFEIVLSVGVVLYIVGYTSTVRKFYRREVAIRTVGHRVQRLRLSFLARSITIVVLFSVAPYLRYRLNKLDEQTEERRRREEAHQKKLAEVERQKVNGERAKFREAWIKEHSLTLFYHTMSGITVVMTPAQYEACQMSTKWHRRNVLWENDILMPDPHACLFIDAKGFDLFVRNHGGTHDPIEHSYVSGWLTALDELVDRYGITLEQKPEIFVPFVNESVLPFKEHKFNREPRRYVYDLVIMQTPEEMHPV